MQLYAKVFSDKGFSIYPPLYQPNSFFLRTKPKRDTVEGGGGLRGEVENEFVGIISGWFQ